MKRSKRQARVDTSAAAVQTPERKPRAWWPWAVASAALFVVFEVYTPALNGPFVLDDRALPFDHPKASQFTFLNWIRGVRPLLMTSYWINYQSGGTDPYGYHTLNVLLHFLGSIVITFVALRLLRLAGMTGRAHTALGLFAGALFLLHPLQTESVAYVASRSEVLSTLLYFSAFAVFLYWSGDRLRWLRALAIIVLFGAALSTKEHTLTLPVLLLLADAWWRLGGWRKNSPVYVLMGLSGAGGAVLVWRLLSHANTAGFHVAGLTPAIYFYTQCRVVWTYVRMFFLPFGQNADPDIPVSVTILEHGAIFGLLAWATVVAAAWIYRKRFPLASFGVLMFLLLIAPTSSIVPIRDVLAERRLYLPFLGLALVTVDFLRRLNWKAMCSVAAVTLLACTVLTYQRSAVWGSSLALWQDAVEKSPKKVRPRFQLAYAYYELGQCPQAAENYERANALGGGDAPLLVDWALALDCAGRPADALDRLKRAASVEPSAHIEAQIGMIYGKQHKMAEALDALKRAEAMDPSFDMTYVYRGNVYEVTGDKVAAAREYTRAVNLNPNNQTAREALGRVSR
jgi:tetratricopeptide (TPR) repeat protein